MKAAAPARPGDADWKAKLAALKFRQRQMRQVARALGLDPDSPKGEVLCEFLLGEIFGQALEKPRSPSTLLRELQHVVKAVPVNSSGRKKKTMASERKNLRHHLEQLYGPGVVVVEEVDEEAEEKTGSRKTR